MSGEVVGAILAGGAGRRLTGKPSRPLAGRPLVSYPLAVLSQVCERVAVVTKPGVELPVECERWDEPATPRHPLTGIVHALERAGGAVLVCAADMPFVTAAACRALVGAGGEVAVAEAAGRLEPLLAVYTPAVLDRLRAAPSDVALRRLVATLAPARVELPGAVVRSVNTPADLAAAEDELRASASSPRTRPRR